LLFLYFFFFLALSTIKKNNKNIYNVIFKINLAL
jgi:hypothetical protein